MKLPKVKHANLSDVLGPGDERLEMIADTSFGTGNDGAVKALEAEKAKRDGGAMSLRRDAQAAAREILGEDKYSQLHQAYEIEPTEVLKAAALKCFIFDITGPWTETLRRALRRLENTGRID